MCKLHPGYKAIRKPKTGKLTGKTCEACWTIYREKHPAFHMAEVVKNIRLTIFDPGQYPEDKRPIDHDYDPSKF